MLSAPITACDDNLASLMAADAPHCVQRAKDAGWFTTHWNSRHAATAGDTALSCRPSNGDRATRSTRLMLLAIAAGYHTITAMRGITKTNRSTTDAKARRMTDLGLIRHSILDGAAHYTITAAGRAWLASHPAQMEGDA